MCRGNLTDIGLKDPKGLLVDSLWLAVSIHGEEGAGLFRRRLLAGETVLGVLSPSSSLPVSTTIQEAALVLLAGVLDDRDSSRCRSASEPSSSMSSMS